MKQPFSNNRLDYIINLIEPLKKDKILNVGISNIPEIEQKIESRINECWTVDIDDKKLKKAGKFLKKTILANKDITKHPFKKNYFDKVVMLEVLEHLDEDVATVKWAGSILKKDGSLILSVPNNSFLHFFNPVKYFQHKRHYSNKKIKEILEQEGFKIKHFNLVECWTFLLDLYIHIFLKFVLKKNAKFGIFRKKSNKTYSRLNKNGLDIVVKAIKV
jgi:SAM-dependent methyltransferase